MAELKSSRWKAIRGRRRKIRTGSWFYTAFIGTKFAMSPPTNRKCFKRCFLASDRPNRRRETENGCHLFGTCFHDICFSDYFVLNSGSNVDYYVEVLPKSNVLVQEWFCEELLSIWCTMKANTNFICESLVLLTCIEMTSWLDTFNI